MSSLKIRREQGPLFLPLGIVKSLSIFKEVGVGRRPHIGCVATFPYLRLCETFPYAALNATFIRLPFRRHPYSHSHHHHHHLPTGEHSVTATVNRVLGPARSRQRAHDWTGRPLPVMSARRSAIRKRKRTISQRRRHAVLSARLISPSVHMTSRRRPRRSPSSPTRVSVR